MNAIGNLLSTRKTGGITKPQGQERQLLPVRKNSL